MLYALTPLLFATLALGSCNADNCLRALRATQTPGRLQAAQSFCSTFTKVPIPATAIPSYAAVACQNDKGRISSACSCIAVSTSSASPTITAGACATVSSLSASLKAATPAATPTIPASIAHACLESVPLNSAAAVELVDAIEPYLEWQSDSAYKKNPPADYFYPPIDIFGKLASIKANLKANLYVNEYAFQQDLYQVFAPGHDGHYVLYPDLLSKAFEWGRARGLVSISKDGREIPEIYIYEDITASPSTASVLKLINGIDASTYVQNYAYTASFNQDADAAYNTMFFEKAFVGEGTGNGYFFRNGRVRYIYPGPDTTFTYANGTTFMLNNVAYVKGDFSGVTDGPSFYQKFCTGPVTTESAAAVNEVLTGPPGYPVPVITTGDAIVSGYYLDGKGFEDVAVISLLAFESESPVEFQTIAQKFIADAKAAGKTKMVVDLSANGGGYILQGYDLYRQFFPDIIQEDYTRVRENPQMLAAAKVFSDAIPDNYDPDTASDEIIGDYENFLNWRYDYNLTEQPFTSFEDKFAPHVYAGDAYTNIIRWNFNDPLTTSNSSWGFGTDITGYGSRTNFTQPFAAEDIILLYDGYCASTCTIFSEFMRLQGGVKSIAMGGRPNKKPIQGVGGIKGAQSFGFADILYEAQSAIEQTTDAKLIATLSVLNDLPINRSSATGINLRDNILPYHLNDGLPAQYVVEEADCRLYYTLPMINDVTELWKGAATAAWGGGKCVAGAGLGKREEKAEAKIMKRSHSEVKRDAEMRTAMLKRMELEKATTGMVAAKYGKKVIQ